MTYSMLSTRRQGVVTLKMYDPGLDRLGATHLLALRDPCWVTTHTLGTAVLYQPLVQKLHVNQAGINFLEVTQVRFVAAESNLPQRTRLPQYLHVTTCVDASFVIDRKHGSCRRRNPSKNLCRSKPKQNEACLFLRTGKTATPSECCAP